MSKSDLNSSSIDSTDHPSTTTDIHTTVNDSSYDESTTPSEFEQSEETSLLIEESDNYSPNGNEKNKKKVGLTVFYFICWIVFMVISVVLVFVIFFISKNENKGYEYNQQIPLGLRYGYKEVNSETGKEIAHGTLFLESDRLIGKSSEMFVEGDKTVYVYNQLSNVGGSNKYDCTAQCVCGEGRRFAVVYPIFQTLFALSVAFATTMLIKNMEEECRKYEESCELEEESAECKVREDKQGSLKEYTCSGKCKFDFASQFSVAVPPASQLTEYAIPNLLTIQAVSIEEARSMIHYRFETWCIGYWETMLSYELSLKAGSFDMKNALNNNHPGAEVIECHRTDTGVFEIDEDPW